MKLYDEFGNYIREFIEDSKDRVTSSFEDSPGDGCLAVLSVILFSLPWLILLVILWLVLKLIGIVLKFIMRTGWWLLGLIVLSIWWLIRLPFSLIFHHETPDWWFPEW